MKLRRIIGVGVVLVAALIYLFAPSRSKISTESKFLRDKLLMGQVGQALVNFSKDNGGAYPAGLDSLRDRYIRNYDEILAAFRSDEGYLVYSPPPIELPGSQDGSRILLILCRKHGYFIFSSDGRVRPLALESTFTIINEPPEPTKAR
jgi:hypothetical protein